MISMLTNANRKEVRRFFSRLSINAGKLIQVNPVNKKNIQYTCLLQSCMRSCVSGNDKVMEVYMITLGIMIRYIHFPTASLLKNDNRCFPPSLVLHLNKGANTISYRKRYTINHR